MTRNLYCIDSLVNSIILNCQQSSYIDIYQGKIGVLPLLYKYGSYSNNPNYLDIADKFLMEVLSMINEKTPIGMNGISGIGWILNYLEQHKFISANNKVFKEIDNKILAFNSSNWMIENGIIGIGLYLFDRLSLVSSKNSNSASQESYNILEKLLVIFQLLQKENKNFNSYYYLSQHTSFNKVFSFVPHDVIFKSLITLSDKNIMLSRFIKLQFFKSAAITETQSVLSNIKIVLDDLFNAFLDQSFHSNEFLFHYAFHKTLYSSFILYKSLDKPVAPLLSKYNQYINHFAEIQPLFIRNELKYIKEMFTLFKIRYEISSIKESCQVQYKKWLSSYFDTSKLLIQEDKMNRQLLGWNISLGMEGLGGLGLMCLQQEELITEKWQELYCI